MESFQLLVSISEDLISKGVQVGPNSAATVTIMDNDGELYSTIYVNASAVWYNKVHHCTLQMTAVLICVYQH